MSYESELEFADQLVVALTYITDKCEEHEEEYPLMTKAIFTLLFGVVVEAEGECPYCKKGIQITSQQPTGGLDSALDVLIECIQALDLEVEFELPFQPPDYEI